MPALAMPKCSLNALTTASFALPFSGAALTQTFYEPSAIRSTRSCFALVFTFSLIFNASPVGRCPTAARPITRQRGALLSSAAR